VSAVHTRIEELVARHESLLRLERALAYSHRNDETLAAVHVARIYEMEDYIRDMRRLLKLP